MTGLRYEYDGNPHSFGSYHPQYVNYAQREKDEKESGCEGGTTGASSSLLNSIRSDKIRGKNNNNDNYEYVGGGGKGSIEATSTSLINGREIFNVPVLSDPPSGIKRKSRKGKQKDDVITTEVTVAASNNRFPHPFIFDKQDIFSAMDSFLKETDTVYFEY